MSDPYRRDRRLGRWFISALQEREYPGILQHIQDTVLVLRAWPELTRDRTEFLGRGEQFDIVDEGDQVPQYQPRIVDERVEWHRIGPPVVVVGDLPTSWEWTPGQPIQVAHSPDEPTIWQRFLRSLKAW